MQGSGENDVGAQLMEIQFKNKILSMKKLMQVREIPEIIHTHHRMAYCSINHAKLNNQMVIKA